MKNYLDLSEFQSHPLQAGVLSGSDPKENEYAIAIVKYLVDGGIRARIVTNQEIDQAWYTISATLEQIEEWTTDEFPGRGEHLARR